MRLYAATPAHRSRQVTGDLLLLAWVVAWVWVGRLVSGLVGALADPVLGIHDRAADLSRSMHEASDSVHDLPLVGDRLQTPFDKASGTGSGIARSSQDLVDQIHRVGTVLGVLVATIPIVLVAAWWLARRVAFVRQASVAQRFVDADADLELFALRAMAHQPLPVLARITDDPVGAWRRGERETVTRLAEIGRAHV